MRLYSGKRESGDECEESTSSAGSSDEEESMINDSCSEKNLDDGSGDEDILLGDIFNPFKVTYFYSLLQCCMKKE